MATKVKKEAKKVAKPKAKAKSETVAAGPGNSGIDRPKDLPWCDKKVNLLKLLKGMKATSATNARGTVEIAEKSGGDLSNKDVRHYGYHARAAGLIDVADVEEVRGHAFYLTAKGAKLDPAKEYKNQESAKNNGHSA